MKVINFLNYQIENRKSVPQKSVFDCSELNCLKYLIKLSVLGCEKNSHPV